MKKLMLKTLLAGKQKWNPRRGWANNIELSHREIGYEDENWIWPNGSSLRKKQ